MIEREENQEGCRDVRELDVWLAKNDIFGVWVNWKNFDHLEFGLQEIITHKETNELIAEYDLDFEQEKKFSKAIGSM